MATKYGRSNGSFHRVLACSAGGPGFDSRLRHNTLRCSIQKDVDGSGQASTTNELGSCWLSLRYFYKPECQSQKANNAGRIPPVYIDEKIQHILASTMPLIIEFFIKIKSQFGRF